MTEGIYYQVGDATDPQESDPKFLEYDAAQEDALLQSEEHDYVIAIWEIVERTGNATTHRLVYQDTVWLPG